MKRILFLLLITISFTVPNFATTLKYTSIPVENTVTETVYVTKTGSKYHRDSCHYLKKTKIKTSKSRAKHAGYTACKVCKP